METKNIIIKKVCSINSETIKKSDKITLIKYLDTSNITRNKIQKLQILDKKKLPFPSRAKRRVKNRTIIYSTVRPNQEHYGYLEEVDENLIVSTGFLTLDVIDPNIEPKFLYYYLTRKEITNYLHNIAVNNVSSYPSINPEDLGNLEIPIIKDKNIQKKIVDYLSNIDKKIELNNKINAELESMAKTIFNYWFVQFDFPDENGKPYKSNGGKMVWNEELKREIPKGWQVESILKYCKVIDCLHSKKPDYFFENEDYYLLQLENIMDNGLLNLSQKYYVSKQDYDLWTSRIKVKENDIIITNAGRVAANAQIPKDIITGIGRNITAIRPTNINPTFMFLSFQGAEMKRQIKLNTDQGTFFTSLNVKGIKKLYLTIPPKELEKKFEEITYSFRIKRELANEESLKLIELRDFLLPMLMNGQIAVS